MEKKEKRTRLSEEQQRELVNSFVLKQGANPFTLGDFKDYLKTFDWFKKISDQSQNGRALRYLDLMKDMLGDKMKQTHNYLEDHGSPNSYVIDGGEDTTLKTKRCSEETLRKFYLIIKRASESKVGISKRDVETIMGYKTPLSTRSVDNLNEYIFRETGFRPFVIAESPFVDYDILMVDHDTALLILEDLREKLEGSEPIMPEFEDFERVVKKIIKNDYNTLLMFKSSNTIQYSNGDVKRFKASIVGESSTAATIGIDSACEIFKDRLEKRYGIVLKFISGFRKYVTIADTGDNPEIRKALKTIEKTYKSLFDENIVDSSRLVCEEKPITEQEKFRLGVIETILGAGASGKMYLSDLWKKLDNTDIPRGWDLLGLLKKYPEKFRIEHGDRGYSEDVIVYIPFKKEEKLEEVIETPTSTTTIETKEEKPLLNNRTITVAFQEKLDLEYFCKEGYKYLDHFNNLHVVNIDFDPNKRASVRAILKIYYASLRAEEGHKIGLFVDEKKEFIQNLENFIDAE